MTKIAITMNETKQSEIVQLLKANTKAPGWIESAREKHKELKALVYGDDYKDLILQIEHIESEKLAIPRKKYSRPINDLNEKLLSPTHNVYSATGTEKDFDLQGSALIEFITKISNVRAGKSLQQWLSTFWIRDLQVVDPNGLIFFEAKDGKAYPTYKSIDTIRNYSASGIKTKWVIFEPKKRTGENNQIEMIVRYVDDEVDALFKQEGQEFILIESETFDNPFKTCPALVNSDLIRLGSDERLSPLVNVIEAEKEYLVDRSIALIYKRQNGFPIPFRPQIICPTCHGEKKQGDKVCQSCNGTGFLQTKDIAHEIILPIDLDSDAPAKLPSNFAGFIKPDLDFLKFHAEDKREAESDMFEVLWGTKDSEIKDQTATAAMLNLQPMTSKLNKWSSSAEQIEEEATEILANYYIRTKKPDVKISKIRYGRNYIIFSPSFLLESYHNSKEKSDPDTIKDAKLIEYLNSKYQNDPHGLSIALKKKELEMYVHYSVEQVADIFGNMEAQKKMLFIDWWESLNYKEKEKDIKALETLRDTFINQKIIQNGNNSSE